MKKKRNLNQRWNNNKCQCECKKCPICEKYYPWNPSVCSCQNEKHLASIMDDLSKMNLYNDMTKKQKLLQEI